MRRAVDRDRVTIFRRDPHVVRDRVRAARVAPVLHHEQDVQRAAPAGARSLGELAEFLKSLLIGVVTGKMRAGLQHRVPVDFRTVQCIRQVRGHVVARHQLECRLAIDCRNKIARQHQHRKRVRIECFKGPVRHKAEVPEQRPVKHRSETGLSEQADDLVEANAVTNLHVELREQGGIGVDSQDPLLHRPFRPHGPVPADQARLPDLAANRSRSLRGTCRT